MNVSVTLEIVYLGIYPADKTVYVFKYASCSSVCNKKKKKERKKENMCGMLYQGDSEWCMYPYTDMKDNHKKFRLKITVT